MIRKAFGGVLKSIQCLLVKAVLVKAIVLCADFARRCELNLHARSRFDFLLQFKLPHFDGAQKLGISKIIGEELLQFGFNRLDDSLLFQYIRWQNFQSCDLLPIESQGIYQTLCSFRVAAILVG